MWATALLEPDTAAVQWGVVIGASLAAAVVDARSRRIPNLLTGTLLVSGFAHAAHAASIEGLADAGAACLLLALPYVVLFLCAGGGAGDAKLMGALGAWLGLAQGTVLLVSTCLCGVLFALAWAAWHRRVAAVGAHVGLVGRGLLHATARTISLSDAAGLVPSPSACPPLPYGPAILAGSLVAFGVTRTWPLA